MPFLVEPFKPGRPKHIRAQAGITAQSRSPQRHASSETEGFDASLCSTD